MHIVFTEITNKLKSPITIVAWLASTVVCVLTGPFETDMITPTYMRAIFWGTVISVGIAYALLCLHTMFHTFPKLRPFFAKGIALSFFTLTYANAVDIAVSFTPYGKHSTSLALIYLVVAAIAFPISAAIYWLHIRPNEKRNEERLAVLQEAKEAVAKQAQPASRLNNALLSRLNTDLGMRIIRLYMRDHYVEVFSDQGTQLIHMRFQDAVDALSDFNGKKVHRSHWINFDEVKEVVKSDGKIFFKMSDDFHVPISKLKQKELRTLGIL